MKVIEVTNLYPVTLETGSWPDVSLRRVDYWKVEQASDFLVHLLGTRSQIWTGYFQQGSRRERERAPVCQRGEGRHGARRETEQDYSVLLGHWRILKHSRQNLTFLPSLLVGHQWIQTNQVNLMVSLAVTSSNLHGLAC